MTASGGSGHWRLFVALPLPGDAARSMIAALAPYRAAYPDARWLRPESLHVTVRFLGLVVPTVVPELGRAVTATAAQAGPVELASGAGSGNPRGRRGGPGVAWLTVTAGAGSVGALCTVLDPRLPLDAIEGARMSAPPSAHVTVARRATADLIGALREQALGATRITWTAHRLVLFRSHTGTPAGSSYEPLVEAQLGAPVRA